MSVDGRCAGYQGDLAVLVAQALSQSVQAFRMLR